MGHEASTTAQAPVALGDRLLSVCGGDDAPFAAAALLDFQRIVLIAMATEAWFHVRSLPDNPLFVGHVAAALVLSVAAAFSFIAPLARLACAAGMLAVGFEWAVEMPISANHHYLALLCLGLMLLPVRGGSEAATEQAVLSLRALRWVAVIGMFGAGMQKLLHGYWFNGDALAYAINQSESFATLLGAVVPAEEIRRLRQLPVLEGAGPFRVDSWWLAAGSNLTWIVEIALALLFIVRRTRPAAVILSLLFLVGVEVGAREIFFGGLMAGLVTLAWPGNMMRWLLAALIALYATVLATVAGIVPAWSFT